MTDLELGRIDFGTCEMCDQPATQNVLVVPGEVKKSKRGTVTTTVIATGNYANLCDRHADAVERDRGWQEREKERIKAEEERLAEMLRRNQTEFF